MIHQLENVQLKPVVCLFNPKFDAVFVLGTLATALTLGALASISDAALLAVVFLNIWVFANPHVLATYTRIGFNKKAIRKYWFFIFLVPLVVAVVVAFLALAYEIAGLFTLYLIAQTYHVSRQSFGIARNYQRLNTKSFRDDRLSESLIFVFPLWGFLHWCAQSPEVFFGYPIKLPHIPAVFLTVTGVIALILGGCWLVRLCKLVIRGRTNYWHSCFVASHVCVFVIAYLCVTDITLGWLIVNIWHNIQYLLFVWLKNLQRDAAHRDSLQPTASAEPNNSTASFPWRHAASYLTLCTLAGAAVFEMMDWMGGQLLWLGLPTVLIAHFTVNYHHYLVDGVIWKRARPDPAKCAESHQRPHSEGQHRSEPKSS